MIEATTKSRIDCLTVADATCGWLCRVAVVPENSPPSEHEVRLSWADHDYWCHGRLAPGVMVEQLVAYLIANRVGLPLPIKFDAARARRWSPRVDEDLRSGW